MNKYQSAKIYSITSSQTDQVYIGSTCSTLSARMAQHRCAYKRNLAGKDHKITSFEILKFEDAVMTLVAKCPCNDKDELKMFERQHIKAMKTVNKQVPGRTQGEYYTDNKARIAVRQKTYNEANKEAVTRYKGQKFVCACGGKFTTGNKTNHVKSKIHQAFLAAKNVTPEAEVVVA